MSRNRAAVAAEGAGNFVSLDLGDNHGCVVRSDGALFCWGANDQGQSNPGGSTSDIALGSATAVTFSGASSNAVAEVSTGSSHTCARLPDGTVRCWGYNLSGQATGSSTSSPAGVTVVSLNSGSTVRLARSIAAGKAHSCAALDDGRVKCWGDNSSHQLGVPYASSGTVVTVSQSASVELDLVTKVVAGEDHNCALRADGTVWCWGRFDGLAYPASVPDYGSQILTGVADLVAGGNFTCALKADGTVWCWGANGSGQLGDGTTTQRSTAAAVQVFQTSTSTTVTLTDVRLIAAGYHHACATTTANKVFCWGSNAHGELSRPSAGSSATTANDAQEARVQSNSYGDPVANVFAMAGGREFTCSSGLFANVRGAGEIKCWGRNDHLQLASSTSGADASYAISSWPPDFVCGIGYAFLWTSPHGGPLMDSGNNHTCAFVELSGLCSGGGGSSSYVGRGVFCWGRNASGQLGDGTTTDRTTPVAVSDSGNFLTTIMSLSAGGDHTCVVKMNGTVWCWGLNTSGQLGNGTTASSGTPVQVSGITNAVEVSAGDDYTCARLVNGQVRCWGSNNQGTLGNVSISGTLSYADRTALLSATSSTSFSNTPQTVVLCAPCTQGASLTGATQISTGASVACARMVNGRVRCWGHNPQNILGTSGYLWTYFDHTSGPVGQYVGDTTNTMPFAGDENAFGNLGTGSSALFSMVSAHDDGACVVRHDGAAQCWGGNQNYVRGNGAASYTQTLSLVTIANGTLDRVSAISGGDHTKCALRNNGTIWCWGAGADKQNGQMSAIDSSAAIQIFLKTSSNAVTGAISITAGQRQSCTMTSGVGLYCWGSHEFGNLGSSFYSTGSGVSFERAVLVYF